MKILMLLLTTAFAPTAQAACCGEGGHPCYPKCFVETDAGLVELDSAPQPDVQSCFHWKIGPHGAPICDDGDKGVDVSAQ